MANIINGIAHAGIIREEVKARIEHMAPVSPMQLAVILVGDSSASQSYNNMNKTACEEVGIGFALHCLPESTGQGQVLALIDSLNNTPEVAGILVQLPLPLHLDRLRVVSAINIRKDVDCLHPYNIGLAVSGLGRLLPCTPAGILTLLKREVICLKGKNAVIVGRSDIVGKPLSFLLQAEDATVTVCHRHTENLPEVCRRADVLAVAVGTPKFITAGMVKPGAVIIDVGSNFVDGKLCGDVDFENCLDVASHITPVPGGVGPMTVAALLENCIKAWDLQHE